MFGQIPNKSKQFIISLRVSILAVFSLLFLILLATLVGIFYFHVGTIVERASFLLMSEASYATLSEFNLELLPIESLAVFSTKNIRQYIVNVDKETILIPYMVHLLKENRLSQGAFWADVDGSFIFIQKAPANHFTAQIIHKGAATSTVQYLTLDNMHQLISSNQGITTEDVRQNAWYTLAEKERRAIWSSFYVDKKFAGLCVTSAAIDDKGVLLGVFGIQVSLDSLSSFIAKQKLTANSEFYILDPSGKIIASSDTNKNLAHISVSPAAEQSFHSYQNGQTKNFKINVAGIDYLASFKTIPILADSGWLIGIVIPEVDFIYKIRRLEGFYLLLDIVIFIIGFLIMSYIVTRITSPINRLVHETMRIKNFHLDKAPVVRSHIREVIEIADAIEDMKTGLRSFKSYLPASLVRQLIKTGAGVQIGGTKKRLAILFSDIEGFTKVAEQANPQELAQHICTYFEETSRIITRHSGTIDKYIGDSVMAFWGAPIAVDEPCQDAARSALTIINTLNLTHAPSSQAARFNFKTRIGIHFGEVVVGNIGSSERLNYTVLGDSVNIASRLVNANKLYGTTILVSDTVYELIKEQFTLRLVDHVFLKGKEKSIALYELLAENSHDLSFDLLRYRQAFATAFAAYQEGNWSTAIQSFKACLTIYPSDGLARIFIARCEAMMNKPPKTWHGIWHLG